MSEVRLDVAPRTEFGKGAARRDRRAGRIPAVLYGHGGDPQHFTLPALEFARVVRENGTNAVLTLSSGGGATQLALTKTITIHPIRRDVEHVDLLLVKTGERLAVDVRVVITGDAAPGAMVMQDADQLHLEADPVTIPEQVEVSVQGLTPGTQVLASQVELPDGIQLLSDPDTLVVNVVAAPTAADMEAEIDTEGAGVVEDAPETPADEQD